MSTEGIVINTQKRWLGDLVELLSSMRFAISLLTIISIAAVIGTVLPQNEPMTSYVNRFGPFWYMLFGKLGLYTVYSAWWFLVIMAMLVISTTLCIIRNTPKMLKDVQSWRENVREQSLRNFHHKAEWIYTSDVAQTAQHLSRQIAAKGYRVRLIEKEQDVLLTAKRGAGNKLGYLFAHAAIVIICLGGVLDSDVPISLQQWLLHKTPFNGSGLIASIPSEHRLGVGNPTFRGNTMIAEGTSSSTTVIPQQEGVLIQDLPFTIYLRQFIVDYYSTGMPKRFASHVTVRDHATGQEQNAVIEVNKPLFYMNTAIYQSSFEDGGSKLTTMAYPMHGAAMAPHPFNGEVNQTTPLTGVTPPLDIEWSGFRPFNVENMVASGTDVRAVNPNQKFNTRLADTLDRHLGSGAKNISGKELRNVGPSVQYKLRDAAGQAHEFLNYMQPVDIDDAYVFLAGVRENPADEFRYLRIPADDDDSVVEWMRLRAALTHPKQREQAARHYAQRALTAPTADMQHQLMQSALKGLDMFAGDGERSGYLAVSQFLENIPPAEQEKAADVFMKILSGSMWELWQVARVDAGLAPLEMTEAHARFLQLAINALSDAAFYPSPVYLQLTGFEEIKASVFQVTRSPGKPVVYTGCLLLVLGIFAMLYIRERRIWVWMRKQEETGHTHVLLAMSTQRKTLDFEHEFKAITTQLAPLA